MKSSGAGRAWRLWAILLAGTAVWAAVPSLAVTSSGAVKVTGTGTCSGARISKYAVVTAAHCVGDVDHNVTVTPLPSGTAVGGKVVAVHGTRDVAVLCAAPSLGYGAASMGAKKPTDQDDLDIAGSSTGSLWTDTRDIKSTSGHLFHLSGTTTGSYANLPCRGDSGGPAYLGGRLVGIATSLHWPFTCGADVDYTDLTEIKTWISQAAGNQVCDEFVKTLSPPTP